jgi:hypothetical protein
VNTIARRLHHGLTALAIALLLGSAHAVELTVEPAGSELEAEVAAALNDWQAAGVDVDAILARVTVRYGEAARFGPDVRAWVTLRGAADDPDRSFVILISPDEAAPRAALIPAIGVVLGGTLGSGALDPVLDPSGPRRPTLADGRDEAHRGGGARQAAAHDQRAVGRARPAGRVRQRRGYGGIVQSLASTHLAPHVLRPRNARPRKKTRATSSSPRAATRTPPGTDSTIVSVNEPTTRPGSMTTTCSRPALERGR